MVLQANKKKLETMNSEKEIKIEHCHIVSKVYLKMMSANQSWKLDHLF
jgi:hypothetical protein